MRRRPLLHQIILLLVLLALPVACSEHGSKASPRAATESLNEIDRIVLEHMEAHRVAGLALALIENAKTVYMKGYGKAHIALRRDVDPTLTRFRWASLAKTLTGILAVKAHFRGYVDLDENISTYYPEYQTPEAYGTHGHYHPLPEGTHVTLRQLLSHTAGVQHYGNGKSSPIPPLQLTNNESINTGMEWALPYWIENPLLSFPGDHYHYSTPGFNLAGVVLEKALGEKFEVLTQNWIASPARLTTLRPDTLWNMAPHRAEGYLPVRAGFIPDADNDVSWKLAAGGFVSTLEDLARYAESVLDDTLLTGEEKRELWKRTVLNGGGKISYGLGWNVYTTEEGYKKVSHSGSQEKARSRLNLYPEEGLGVAIMTNAGQDVDLSGLAKKLETLMRQSPLVSAATPTGVSGSPPVL